MAITISGSGIVEANLADDAVTLAKMASGTDGQIITYDASGDPAAVGPGSDGQVLTSTGSTTPPAFEAAAAGGKVLQVVSTLSTTAVSTTSSGWTDVLTASITPSLTTSKVLVLGNFNFYMGGTTDVQGGFQLEKSGTSLQVVDVHRNASITKSSGNSFSFLHTANTTSSTEYAIQFRRNYGSVAVEVQSLSGGVHLTLIEIGA